MKIFMDSEFTGLHQDTTLISIGLVSEDGRSFYAEFNDYDKTQVDDWIQENVLDVTKYWSYVSDILVNGKNISPIETDLKGSFELKDDKKEIEKYLRIWLSQFDEVEIWSDVLAYDWILFCDLFNNKLPENVCYIPFDLATLLKLKGIDPDISREEFSCQKKDIMKHNSLYDACVTKDCYEKLIKIADDI